MNISCLMKKKGESNTLLKSCP